MCRNKTWQLNKLIVYLRLLFYFYANELPVHLNTTYNILQAFDFMWIQMKYVLWPLWPQQTSQTNLMWPQVTPCDLCQPQVIQQAFASLIRTNASRCNLPPPPPQHATVRWNNKLLAGLLKQQPTIIYTLKSGYCCHGVKSSS